MHPGVVLNEKAAKPQCQKMVRMDDLIALPPRIPPAGKRPEKWYLGQPGDIPSPSSPGIAVRRTASLPLAYVPAIHVFAASKEERTWMPDTRSRMTIRGPPSDETRFCRARFSNSRSLRSGLPGPHGSPGDAKHRPETALACLLTTRV